MIEPGAGRRNETKTEPARRPKGSSWKSAQTAAQLSCAPSTRLILLPFPLTTTSFLLSLVHFLPLPSFLFSFFFLPFFHLFFSFFSFLSFFPSFSLSLLFPTFIFSFFCFLFLTILSFFLFFLPSLPSFLPPHVCACNGSELSKMIGGRNLLSSPPKKGRKEGRKLLAVKMAH